MKSLRRSKGLFRLCLPALLLPVMLCTACDERTVYHGFRSIPSGGWAREDTLCFEVSVPDSQTCYRVSVEVRNRNDYPYQNLILAWGCETPDTCLQAVDSLHFRLADAEGIWTGSGWGGLYLSALPAGSVRIGKAGEYRFRVVSLMSDEVLRGVNDVGIRIERTD